MVLLNTVDALVSLFTRPQVHLTITGPQINYNFNNHIYASTTADHISRGVLLTLRSAPTSTKLPKLRERFPELDRFFFNRIYRIGERALKGGV